MVGSAEYSPIPLFTAPEASHVTMDLAETYSQPFLGGHEIGHAMPSRLTISGQVVPVHIGPACRGLRRGCAVMQNPAGYRCEVQVDDVSRWELTETEIADEDCWAVPMVQGHKCDKCEPTTVKWHEGRFLCLKVATYLHTLVDMSKTFFLVLESVGADQKLWRRFGLGSSSYFKADDDDSETTGPGLFDNAEKRTVAVI